MCIDFDGHHSGSSSFVYVFDIVILLLKKKTYKESQFIVSRPQLGLDPPIGRDRESGRDKLVLEPRFRRFWKSLRLRMYLHSKVLA